MFKCKICGKKYTELEALYNHIESKHKDMIPKDMSVQQYYYYMKTGKMNGNCVMCKQPTSWNSNTGKYNRFCGNPKCKDEYVKIMKSRMVAKYGKTHLLNDPNKQREMLANRSISGTYTWSDGKHESTYTGSYELDFLKTLDHFFEWDPEDISMPSPHTYTYKYEGEERFYIPDVFIHSLDLEIEIKDGGDNPNNHYKIQAIDKHKEALKDEVMCSQKIFHYVKITNKNYENFFQFLKEAKKEFEKYGDEKKIPRIFKIEDIKGTNKEYIRESVDTIEENYFFDQEDIYRNIDKFETGEKHILFITGHSGSGKSTLGKALAKKYNAKYVELDYLSAIDHKPTIKNTIFEEYVNKKGLGDFIPMNSTDEEYAKFVYDFIEWLIHERTHERLIVEGIQVFCVCNPETIKEYPIIIKNVSVVNSILRARKRDYNNWFGFIKGLPKEIQWRVTDEKYFRKFKRGINESDQTIEDTDIIEEMNKIDGFVEKFNDWNDKPYRQHDMFLSLRYELVKNDPKELQQYLSKLIKAARFKDDIIYIEKMVKKTDDHYKKLMRKYPDSKDIYKEYYAWIEKGMRGEIKDRKKEYTLRESFDIVEENLLFSHDNIELNLNKFGKEYNTLYITGLGGSGKSTIIKEYAAKYKAEALEFDAITSALIKGLENLNRNKIHPLILEYLETQNPNKLNGFSDPGFNVECVKFLDWFENRVTKDDKLYIIEGMQIFICFNPERFIGKPMVIMGTSVVKSMFRSVSRKYKRSEGDIIKTFEFFLKTLKRTPIFVKNDKQINKLIDTISKCYIEEKFEPDKFLVWFDKPIQKLKGGKIKLYHGTLERRKGNTFVPFSINVGATKYSDPRWSIYFWDNREDAMLWSSARAVMDIVGVENMIYIGHNEDSKVIVKRPKGMTDKEFANYLIEKSGEFYIYEVEVDIKDLEVGARPIIREYTVSKPVDILKEYKYKLNKEIIRRCVRMVDEVQFKDYDEKYGILNNTDSKRGSVLNAILDPHRNSYRPILITELRNGNVRPGDDISDFRYSINRHLKANTYNFESYIIDTMKESSISIPQMNYYLQNEYEEEMRKYLNTYKKYYNLMLKEQPSAVKHINEDIRKCLIVIDGLAEKGVENNLVQFAKDDLGEIVKAAKHGKPVRVYEGTNVINLKVVYDNPNSKHVFSLSDMTSKIIVEEDYIIQRDKVGTHCSVTPYYNEIDRINEVSFKVELPDYIEIENILNNLTEGVIIANLFKFEDREFKFIKEASLKLFGSYPINIREV